MDNFKQGSFENHKGLKNYWRSQYHRLKVNEKEEAFAEFQQLGNIDIWPFLKTEDYKEQLKTQPFLNGKKVVFELKLSRNSGVLCFVVTKPQPIRQPQKRESRKRRRIGILLTWLLMTTKERKMIAKISFLKVLTNQCFNVLVVRGFT
jgi:hypothetical protein